MKYTYFTSWICAFGLGLLIATASSEAQAQSVAAPLSVQTLTHKLSSPEKIAHYIWRHFQFETDQAQFGHEEHWQSPEELLASRKGDCEDFALFAAKILKANGITSFLINVYGDRFAHTVCVFKDQGKYHILDGDEVKRYEADTLEEVFAKIYPHWKEAAIVAYCSSSSCGKILKRFKRSQ